MSRNRSVGYGDLGHLERDVAGTSDHLGADFDQLLFVCDMSVMPFSSAANPVRTLAAFALRLSRHFG